jgi:hypothetical protein
MVRPVPPQTRFPKIDVFSFEKKQLFLIQCAAAQNNRLIFVGDPEKRSACTGNGF